MSRESADVNKGREIPSHSKRRGGLFIIGGAVLKQHVRKSEEEIIVLREDGDDGV
jgi:hypothetical protein